MGHDGLRLHENTQAKGREHLNRRIVVKWSDEFEADSARFVMEPSQWEKQALHTHE
jgi:hypothetical protein